MTIGRRGVGFLLFLVACIALGIYLVNIFNHGELADKEKYSLLQGVEYKYRSTSLPPVFLLRSINGRDDILGLKTTGAKFPRSWILLNRLASNGTIARMPEGDYLDVRCEDVREGLRGVEVLPAVITFLSKNCKS